MKISMNRTALSMLAVAAIAYAAGTFNVLSPAGNSARAQAKEPAGQPQLDPKIEAWMKAGAPGPNHRYLDQLVGQWNVEFKMTMEPGQPPMVSQGTVSRQWIFDGRYLHETVDATSDMGTLSGVSYMGYNNIDGQYEFIWLDSMSTQIYFETGTYDPKAKVLTTRGSHRDPVTGHVVPTWGKMDLSNPDRHTFTGYSITPEGQEFKSVEGIAVRKK